jgi:hypothetical protein
MNPFLFDSDSDYMFGEEDSYGGQLNLKRFAALNKALTKGMPGAPGGKAAMAAIPPGVRAALGRAAQIEAYRGDDVIYGLDSGGVNLIIANETRSLSTSPQKRNVPTRLVVSQTVANNFVLSDIRVGVEPVLATTQSLSMSIFVQDSTAPNFRAVVAEVGMDVSVTVTNITGAPARFTSTIVGAYLAPSL